MTIRLEHTNITVSDPDAFAKALGDLFGWKVRWSGEAMNGGRTVHVGTAEQYMALYTGTAPQVWTHSSYDQIGGLNHIGLVVDDLDAMETHVKTLGYTPTNHGDYEPGRRFYFDGPDGIEFEIVSYT